MEGLGDVADQVVVVARRLHHQWVRRQSLPSLSLEDGDPATLCCANVQVSAVEYLHRRAPHISDRSTCPSKRTSRGKESTDTDSLFRSKPWTLRFRRTSDTAIQMASASTPARRSPTPVSLLACSTSADVSKVIIFLLYFLRNCDPSSNSGFNALEAQHVVFQWRLIDQTQCSFLCATPVWVGRFTTNKQFT